MIKRNLEKNKLGQVIGLAIGLLIGLITGSAGAAIIFAIAGSIIGSRFNLKIKKPGFEKSKVIDIKKRFNSPYLYVFLVIFIFLVYLLRPWFHEFTMVFYTKPILIFLILCLIGTAFLFKSKKNNSLISIGIMLVLFSLVIVSLNDIIVEKYIVSETVYNKISKLPDSSEVRMLPRATAYRYLADSLQKSRETLGDINIVNLDDKLMWVAPRIPDGAILYFTQKVNGIMTAEATKVDRKTNLINAELKVGENIGITDNIYWKLFKKRYFVDIGDVYYIKENDKIITVAPVIAYRFKFPVMIPYYKGIFLVDPEGNIDFKSPSEVKFIKQFQNNRAYPEELARLYVDSYKYHKGIINAWIWHKDQIEISDVYGQYNQQPFLMPTVEGLKWVVATEPYGKSYGVFKIFLVDALTGKIDLLEMNEDQTLTGPVKVVSYVKKKFPRIDWSTAKVVEPRPYVVDNKLYWMLSITPIDFAGISYTVFVNSENNEVIAFDDEVRVYDFVTKGIFREQEEEEYSEKETTPTTKEEKTKELINDIESKLEELKKLVE